MRHGEKILMCINVLLPVYNDWAALYLVFEKMKSTLSASFLEGLSFIVVDDGSEESIDQKFYDLGIKLKVLQLNRNVGHQKAIAIGLSYIAEYVKCDAVIVMDSDGEDDPLHITDLINAYNKELNKIIFAGRTKRNEGVIFRLFYYLYKFCFRILTGKGTTFGNFCIIPYAALRKLVYVSQIWNHFSAGVIYSKLKYETIPLERGKRLVGDSKMKFNALLLHGLSAIAVHVEETVVRILIFTIGLFSVATLGILSVMILRFFTNFTILGWATSTLMNLGIIMLQSFLISLVLLFIILIYRMQKLFVPARDYKDYIQS